MSEDPSTRLYDEAQQLEEAGDLEAAAVKMHGLLQLVRDAPGLWTYYGGLLVLLERWQDAREAYEEALEIDPSHLNGYLGMGMMLAESGDLQQAKSWFERALELDPECALAQDALWDLKQHGTLS